MKNPCVILLALVFAGAVHAQGYKWIDKDGKTRYGDRPPTGVKATPLQGPAWVPPPTAPAAASGSKDVKNTPLPYSGTGQDIRKRQQQEAEDRKNAALERQARAKHAQDCAGVKQYLRALQSDQPVPRSDAAGKGKTLNEGETVAEIARARMTLKLACSG